MSNSAKVMFERGLPHPYDQDVEKKYCEYTLDLYLRRRDEWAEELLLQYFKEDFEDFTLEMFKNLRRNLRRDLRQHLTKHRVYAPIGVCINITTALHDFLTKKLSALLARSVLSKNIQLRTAESMEESHDDGISQIKRQVAVLADNISQLSSKEKINSSPMVDEANSTNNTPTQHNVDATATS